MRILFSIALGLTLSFNGAFAALDPVLEAADLRLPEAPALREAAESKKPKRRALAASAWGRIMSPKGIDPLLKLTKDQLPFVREAAAFALGQLGWQEESSGGRLADIQAALSSLLHDKQPAVRLAAVEAIGKVGLAEAPALLAPAFSSKEAPLRAEAVMALFRSRMILKLRNPSSPPGELPEELRKSLEALIGDKDSSVRLNVAYLFARNAEPKAEAAAVALLRDKNMWTRLFAASALGKMKARGAKQALLAATSDPEFQVRLAALSALLASGASALDAPALAGDKSFHVRAAFAAGLSAEKANELEVLRNLAADESPTVRAEAVKSLAKAHKEDLPGWLRAQERGAHWLVREAAVQSLNDTVAEGERIAFLTEHLVDPEINVRAAALEALLTIPGEAAFTQLKRALESEELAIRGTAVAALKDRKEAEAAALAWKTYNDSLETRWVEMREEIVEVFAKITNEETTARLRSLLQDPAGSVRAKARKALESRGVGELPVYPEPALSRSPYRHLSFRRAPFVELETSRGRVVLETFPEAAPVHVADMVGNVRAGYYDGLSWHRVVANFVVQGGDPEGSGWGGAGYALRAEINRNRFLRGALGMPRSAGFDTGGSQLFFSLVPTPHLDGQYTVYGQVVEGTEVLDRLERGDRILKARIVHRK